MQFTILFSDANIVHSIMLKLITYDEISMTGCCFKGKTDLQSHSSKSKNLDSTKDLNYTTEVKTRIVMGEEMFSKKRILLSGKLT